MDVERNLGFEPVDREFDKLGYDIESRDPTSGKLRFIEVKGRAAGAATVTVTRNEVLYSLNKPDDFILGIVEFDGDDHRVHYVRRPFQKEPDFGVTSINYDFAELLSRANPPMCCATKLPLLAERPKPRSIQCEITMCLITSLRR